jgi:hypothetical protein
MNRRFSLWLGFVMMIAVVSLSTASAQAPKKGAAPRKPEVGRTPLG